MICWSCEKAAGQGELCERCGALQPPDPAANHFGVLGIERRFAIDLSEVERRYKDAARRLHPDKFVKADPRARRASLARSVRVNDAWKTLKDPVRRAEYLLSLEGIEVGGEQGTVKRTTAGETRVPVPQELLMDVMELREGLLDARAERDHVREAALAADVRARRAVAMEAVAVALGSEPADLEQASRELVAVRYYDRFLAEVSEAAGSSGAVLSGAGSPARG